MRVQRVKSAFLFDNGMIAACDLSGQQIPELQGSYSIEGHKRLLLEALDNCEFTGFESVPMGWLRTVNAWFNHFKHQSLSWEEITEL